MGRATRPGVTLQGKPSDEVVEADDRGDVVVVVADPEALFCCGNDKNIARYLMCVHTCK